MRWSGRTVRGWPDDPLPVPGGQSLARKPRFRLSPHPGRSHFWGRRRWWRNRSRHLGGVVAARADGSVAFYGDSIAAAVLQGLGTTAGGDRLDAGTIAFRPPAGTLGGTVAGAGGVSSGRRSWS